MIKKYYSICMTFLCLFSIVAVDARAEIQEVYEENFYRAPGGAAYFSYPELKDKNWKIELTSAKDGNRILKFTLRGPKSYRFFFNMMFTIKYNGEDDARKILETLATQQKSGSPHLVETGNTTKTDMFGGQMTMYAQHLEGTSPSGVAESLDVAVVTDGSFAVLIIMRGNKQDYSKAMQQLVMPALKTLRIGKTTLWLKDQDVPVKLDGVYIGPYKWSGSTDDPGKQYWFIFDKRGYVRDRAPYGQMELDFDAHLQKYGKDIKFGTYAVQGGTLSITWRNGKKQNLPITIKNDKRFLVDGEDYDRLNGLSDGMKLAGHWGSSSSYSSSLAYSDFSFFSSRSYYFTADGKFSFDSFAGCNSVNKDSYGNMKDWLSAGTETNKPLNRGMYKIDKDRIWLYYENGTVVYKTFYVNVRDGKVSTGVIYIGGSNYLKD